MSTIQQEDSVPKVFRQGKFHVVSIGCIESNLAGTLYNNFLLQNNWIEVTDLNEADIVICVTCGVTNIKINQSIRAINDIEKQLKPHSYVIVAGCVPKIVGEQLQKELGPKTIITPSPADLENIIEKEIPLSEIHANSVRYKYMRMRMKAVLAVRKIVQTLVKIKFPLPKYLPRVVDAYEDPNWFYVNVGHGCLLQCAFCAINLAKGRVRSRSLEPIIHEIKMGIEQGHKKFVLSADDVGAWGQDTGSDFVQLMKGLISIEGDFQIYVRNLEPIWILKYFDTFIEVAKSNKLRAITVPLQSGSDKVLKAMKRGHKINPIIEKLNELNRQAPELLVLTHFMVGMPYESHKEFVETLKVIKNVRFEGIAPDRFYAHPSTAAYTMDEQVSNLVKWYRHIVLTTDIIWSVYFNRGIFWRLR